MSEINNQEQLQKGEEINENFLVDIEELEESIKCPVCVDFFDEGLRAPQSVEPCKDHICFYCIFRVSKSATLKQFRCPYCARDVESFSPNEEVIKKMEKYKKICTDKKNGIIDPLHKCDRHVDKEYFAVCIQCMVPICCECVIDEHNGHRLRSRAGVMGME
eukprot:gene960-1223_t